MVSEQVYRVDVCVCGRYYLGAIYLVPRVVPSFVVIMSRQFFFRMSIN